MKNQTFKDQLQNKEARSPQDIKKLFPFVQLKSYKEFSNWHMKEVTYTQYGFKKDNKTFWFNRRTSDNDASYEYDDIIIILNTLEKNNFKYSCGYCGKGMLGSPNRFLDLIEFLNWVKENNYSFDKKRTSIYQISKNHWRFSGNLKEYSCAFSFDIFDRDILRKVYEKQGVTFDKLLTTLDELNKEFSKPEYKIG